MSTIAQRRAEHAQSKAKQLKTSSAKVSIARQSLDTKLDQQVAASRSREQSLAKLREAMEMLRGRPIPNLKPLLPLMLNIKGKPYHLDNHFPFEPFFSSHMARRTLLKTGRQVSKSTSLAAQGVVISNCIPFFNTLYVTPLYEMIRRFSGNYVKGFIDQSPVRPLFVSSNTNNNVLQRSFTNNSTMFFSFAFLDAERTRGLNCDKVSYDEVQDLDKTFIPIIRETMSGSVRWGIEQFAGTPKTLENTIEELWQASSQAEWNIKCQACNYWNIPALAYDLDKMIGPEHVNREISERYPGIVCAKCGRPVYPRTGCWIHAHPELRHEFEGYHVPQIILPMHYASQDKWGILLGKRAGFGGTSMNVFYNEVCGESYDQGAKLVTITDLKRAAVLHENSYELARSMVGNYVTRFVSVDWGGGGIDHTGKVIQSYTVAAVLGMLPDGKIDVIYGWRSPTPHDHNFEAARVLQIIKDFRCTHLVSDFGGAGSVRESIIVNAGLPVDRLIPVAYQRAGAGAIMTWKAENEISGMRSHYRVDKSRSLGMTCQLIKSQQVRFFAYDHKGSDRAGLLHDFLSLVEDNVDSRTGSHLYTIIRNKKSGPDDFAQAVNIGVCAMYYKRGKWPDLELARYTVRQDLLSAIHPDRRLSDLDFDDN